MNDTIAIYIHWPFCTSKCPYCDFNSFVSKKIDHTRWKKALLCELKNYESEIKPSSVSSIFFGGGSPSLMNTETVAELIDYIRTHWGFNKDVEITLEANPTSIETTRLQDYRDSGVNRLSLGVQSLDETTLRFLGRGHSAKDARKGIVMTAECFPRFSFDLIYGHPKQTPVQWQKELSEALTLAGGHISLYQLTIEPGTVFHRYGVPEASEDIALALLKISQELLKTNGLLPYEISNYARPGEECRHNLTCWRGGDYLGIGPGAHGRLTSSSGTEAIRQIRSPEKWLRAVENKGHGTARRTTLSPQERCEELLLIGLRLKEGINKKRFFALTGKKIEHAVSSSALEQMIQGGFLKINEKTLYATKAGQLRLNSILVQLLTI